MVFDSICVQYVTFDTVNRVLGEVVTLAHAVEYQQRGIVMLLLVNTFCHNILQDNPIYTWCTPHSNKQLVRKLSED